MIEIQVNKTVKSRVPEKLIKKVNAFVVKRLKVKSTKFVSLAVVSEKTIKKINFKYRKKNKVTDVLSFENIDKDDKNYLGEILICQKQIQRQAKLKKHSVRQEFMIMYVHGLLHLFGFDHKNIKQAKKMEDMEEFILKSINYVKH